MRLGWASLADRRGGENQFSPIAGCLALMMQNHEAKQFSCFPGGKILGSF